MEWPVLTLPLKEPQDVVLARQRAREVAALLGLDVSSQTRFAASVSEVTRNALSYGGGGQLAFAVAPQPRPALLARIIDGGAGIADLEAVLDGRSSGRGISNARRLVDDFAIASGPGGTTVTLARHLPDAAAISAKGAAAVAARLGTGRDANPLAEIEHQNTELVRSLAELRLRQDELQRLNAELEDTNRGVVALYAELDERAEQLRQASELKSRFLSNMSHEFRTPLNSILALSRLLLDRIDGPLAPEQERQVTYIRRSAESLAEMVDDLLDLAKVEAGKLDVRPTLFGIGDLFGALRGVMKPLQVNEAVDLVFEYPPAAQALFTDEGKVAQILRNLISNALKFTERGRVSISVHADDETVSLAVADTGIGIDPANLELVFQEFSQIASPLQGRAKGTGLGLPLSRRLAELLGGTLNVDSTPGNGSTFTLTIPRRFGAPPLPESEPKSCRDILLIDDEETSRYVVRQMLAATAGLRWREAATGAEGLRLALEARPDLVILDLRLPDMDGFMVLEELRRQDATVGVPVIVCTASVLTAVERAHLEQASAVLSKAILTREILQRALAEAWMEGASQ